MADFAQDIQNFKRYGAYTYKFDKVGNNTFVSSSSDFSQVYLSVPLSNVVYNNSRVKMLYTSLFEEFIPNPPIEITSSIDTLQQQLNIIQNENDTLKNQLTDAIQQTNESSGSSLLMQSKQIIIGLRIALGQGRVEANFSPTFPYVPLVSVSSSRIE